jgi:hypothetical protein
MLAGGFAAFVAWLIISPYFDDVVHVRGAIDKIALGDATSINTTDDDGKPAETLVVDGTVTVRGQVVTVGEFTRDPATRKQLDLTQLQPGEGVEAFVRPLPTSNSKQVTWLALYIAPHRATTPDSALSMEDLQRRSGVAGMVIFALMAALIGLFIGAIDGLVCRLWSRALISGVVGLGVGFLGGFVLSIVANLVYTPLTGYAMAHHGSGTAGLSPLGFAIQVGGRTLAWGLVGLAMGLGQGIALRSSRLLVFGLVGGVVGGLLGGLLFDPIDLMLLGSDKPSASISRLVGFVVIGLSVGGMIGLVELLARDAWLRMIEGPLAGKEFLVFRDVMKVGASPRSDIYLFNDPQVEDHHATLRSVGEGLEIESAHAQHQVLVNDRAVRRARLRHGDRITLGRTVFVYQQRGA